MKKFCFFILLLLLISNQSFAFSLEFLGKTEIPHKLKFQKTTVGGLSALLYQADTHSLFALSDDRGTFSEPRIYRMKLELVFKKQKLEKFSVEPAEIIFIRSAKSFHETLDLESMAFLPWASFLIGNEGDNNKKPRQMPALMDVKPAGLFVRNYVVPEFVLPEISGKQTKGARNNMSFEGLTQVPDKNEWIAGLEAPLIQDQGNFVRWIQYTMPEAWVIKPAKQWLYGLEPDSKDALSFQTGVSEILALNENEILALERRFEIGAGLHFKVQLYLANISKATDVSAMDKIIPEPKIKAAEKKLVLDFESLTSQIGKIENFEGMAWGPKLANGKSTLLLVSDDNFMRGLRTQILIFSVNAD